MSPQIDELFLAACGVFGRWTLRISHPRRKVEERFFDAPFALVGSQADNCLCLNDPSVSRRHVYLQALPGGVFCVDVGSRLGLRWDNTEQRSGWLLPDRPVQIGPFKLDLLPNNRAGWLAGPSWAPEDPLAERAVETNPLATVVGDLSMGDKVLAKWQMNRVLGLVGRSPQCLVFVQHKSLSRFHCSLVRTPLGLWVVDLLSSKGTVLNGERVRCARIQEGDVLQAGKFTLRFWYQQPAPRVVNQIPYKKTEERPTEPKPVPEMTGMNLEPLRTLSNSLSAGPPNLRQTQLVGAPDQANSDRAVLLTLVNQFGQMQQQMFDQFQESLLMATRLFASLHQEQMTTVRQELDQLHQLTAELRELQQELKGPRTKPDPVLSPSEGSSGQPAREGSATPTGETVNTAPTLGGPDKPSVTPAEGASVPAANDDIHDWLTHRISALQEERQTRWNKLLGMILGN